MEQKDKPIPQLSPTALHPFEYVSTQHDALIAQGVTPQDLLQPAFWAHHATKLRPYDEIRARAEDGTWIAFYIVLDASRNWARVQQLALHRLTTRDVSLSQTSEDQVKAFIDAHSVTYRGPHKWSIVRKADRNVLTEGIEQKDDAQAWLEKHAREQFAAPPPVAEALAS
jgi:hypothetical protein